MVLHILFVHQVKNKMHPSSLSSLNQFIQQHKFISVLIFKSIQCTDIPSDMTKLILIMSKYVSEYQK